MNSGGDQPVTSVAELIARSRIVGGVRAAMLRIESAAGSGRVTAIALTLQQVWRAMAPWARLRTIGVALFTAVIVHVALEWLQRHPVGWMWLVVPGIALAQAVLLIVMSLGREAERS
jgi:hypothetical protein